jgi:hypothetical protein
MGFKLARVDRIKVQPNEEKDLKIILRPENRGVIHGEVQFPDGCPVEGAVVKLFKRVGPDPCKLVPVTFAFTDKCGQFLFGVDSCVDFVIKVFFFKPEPAPCDADRPC